jgi:predicted membrane protein
MEQSNEKNNDQKPNSARKVVFGLIIVVLGALLLADNFEGLSWHIRSIVFSWPMFFIAIGILNLFGRKSYVTGFIFIMIGVFFLIPKIFYNIDPDFTRMFWPLILIGIGVMIIVRRGVRHEHHHHFHRHFNENSVTDRPEGYIDEVNIFGGSKIKVVSQNFKGGKITSIFGGTELDFTNAQLAEGTNVIDMVCMFGGASMILPTDWHVHSEVVSVLGGFADKRFKISNAVASDRELVIKGVAIFGGGEIKSA